MLRRERRDQQLDLFCKSAFQTSLGLGIPGLLPAPLQNQTQTGHGALPAPGASLPELCVSPKQSIPRISASPEHPLDLCQPREHPLASETTHSSLCSPPRLWCRPGGVPQPAASPVRDHCWFFRNTCSALPQSAAQYQCFPWCSLCH